MPAQAVDAALPAWITADLIARTCATWQTFYEQTLTDDDAVEMLLNVANLYRVLAGEPEDDDEDDHDGLDADQTGFDESRAA